MKNPSPLVARASGHFFSQTMGNCVNLRPLGHLLFPTFINKKVFLNIKC